MLASLNVRDIVLIERAELEFAPGLNVLTGETGAGKSILLDALGLAIGERGQGRSVLRPGAEQASVIAVFDLTRGHPALATLEANGLDSGEGEIILRRTVSADGRTRAFINDSAVGVGLAREMGALLVEVHGQHDDRGLFDNATHRVLLDSFGGHEALGGEVAAAALRRDGAAECLDAVRKAQAKAAEDSDYLTYAVDELKRLAPEAGEEASLTSARALLMNAGRLAEEIAAAADLVSGEEGAETKLVAALRRLSRLSAEAREAAAPAETALDSALALIESGRRSLEALLERLEADPGKLAEVEERLFALRAVARKYNAKPDALAELREEFERKLALASGGEPGIAAAERELAEAHEVFVASARKLSAARAAAARKLEAAVADELAPLKLAHARFRVALPAIPGDAAGVNGLERVAFEIATIEGAEFGALAKIASGGELARFALALKVALAQASPPAVLVFDEVDRGVGGAVAAAVGERLQRLAKTTQVLLVTHSPQVAARAARHFRISRKGDATRIEQLALAQREEEIARMLSGAAVSEEARAAAKRLLAEAVAPDRSARKRATA